jgi:hypothetical protein
MIIIDRNRLLSLAELRQMAASKFGELVKAVDAELHANEEALLLEDGSQQEDLWSINLYPELEGEDFLEFDSMINLRPSRGNRSRGVEDPAVRERIRAVVTTLVIR